MNDHHRYLVEAMSVSIDALSGIVEELSDGPLGDREDGSDLVAEEALSALRKVRDGLLDRARREARDGGESR